jgi:predicted DCC family thiol-disulfide oxidoreductase YuxK
MSHEAFVCQICNTLAAVEGRAMKITWPSVAARAGVKAELETRGYKLVEDNRGKWFVERNKKEK